MPDWTTDLRQAQPGWLVAVDVVRVVPGEPRVEVDRTLDLFETKTIRGAVVYPLLDTVKVEKRGVVVQCDQLTMLVEVEGNERWRVGYSDKGVRVRAPESEARS
jgi:hypothetical protein